METALDAAAQYGRPQRVNYRIHPVSDHPDDEAFVARDTVAECAAGCEVFLR